MLSNYDAKAIAEIMGLAFVRQPELDEKSAAGPRSDFPIRVDGDILFVVEVEAGKTIGSQGPLGASGRKRAGSTRSLASSPSPILIEKAVSGGLPRNALRHLAEALAGADKTKVSALEWDVVPKTTLDRRKSRLSVGESERTERIARLFVHSRRALGTEEEAREFMTTPHPELDGRKPLEVATTDLGTRRAEQILNALEYGLAL